MFDTKQLTGIAVFSAAIVVLQVFATFVKFGPVSITLALVPIVVGAALYGAKAGALLGGVFGFVVLVACVFGWDIGGHILWAANPPITALLCLFKGAAAGYLAGVAYRLVAKNNKDAGAIVAAIVCPIVNTGVFCLAMALFYHDTLQEWAGGTPLLSYVLFGLVGLNFLIELGINTVLSPVVSRILRIVQK